MCNIGLFSLSNSHLPTNGRPDNWDIGSTIDDPGSILISSCTVRRLFGGGPCSGDVVKREIRGLV